MLRAFALADLFTENLDDAARGIFLTTASGTLTGKDRRATNACAKRAAVLGALTWRVSSAALSRGSGSSLAEIDAGKVLRVQSLALRVLWQESFEDSGTDDEDDNEDEEYGRDGRGALRMLILDLDGQAIAYEWVHEGLLAGVFGPQLHNGNGNGNGNGSGNGNGTARSGGAADGGLASHTNSGGAGGDRAHAQDGHQDEEEEHDEGSGDEHISYNSSSSIDRGSERRKSRNGSATTDDEPATGSEDGGEDRAHGRNRGFQQQRQGRPTDGRQVSSRRTNGGLESQLKALRLKVSALAEYLRDELKDFKMPRDIE